MIRIQCPKCKRTIEIEAKQITLNSLGEQVFNSHAHATTLSSEIQCVCGTYIK